MSNDIAYANADFIPGAADYSPRWTREAAAFRDRLSAEGRARLDQPYGGGARQRFDLFLPPDGPAREKARGVLVFVHGGYWRRFDAGTWSHFAAGALERGWAAALPSYTLAPDARIGAITREIASAIGAIADAVPGPIVLTGHSAGGHLVARMVCPKSGLPDRVRRRIARVVPISPIADLRPLIDTKMNDDLRLDAAEARAESPCLLDKAVDVPVTVWVGAEERPVFLDQARWLAEAWSGTDLRVDPGRHHFDVIDGLRAPDSPLMRAILPD